MVLLLLLFLLPFTLIFIYHYIFPTSPSSPPGLPIIGNLHQFDSAELHVFLCKLSKKYGSLMHMKLGYREAVVISSATIAKETLRFRPTVITGKVERLERVFKGLDSFYQELIDKHLHPNRPKSMDGDIIDILLGLMEENSSLVNLTWDHIKAVLMNVLVGGTDTSAVVIIWAMTALMKDPRVMNKVQHEIREFIGREKGKVDEDDIKHLPYFKVVIKETLRLYTPVPLLVSREIISKCTIDDEYEIKPKTIVIINAWAIARDPKYCKDPEEFYPERFLDCNIDYKGQNFEFIPFGAGRRMCPGMTLGLVVAELALANLLYAFDWELPSGMKKEDIDTEPLPGLVMHKKNHLCLFAKNAQV
nr:cytochrome P450 83B1-like [Ipomoea batatas]